MLGTVHIPVLCMGRNLSPWTSYKDKYRFILRRTRNLWENWWHWDLCGKNSSARNKYRVLLERSHIKCHNRENLNYCALCGKKFISMNYQKRKNWIKILERIHITVVCVAKDLSPGSTHRYTWSILLEIIHITVFSVARQWCSGESTLLLSVWRGIILPDHLNRHTKNHAGEYLTWT